MPVFVLPERGENLYHQEVLTLKQQLEQQAREKAQTQAEVEAQQQKLVALNGYIAILEGKQQETEAQTQARLAALEAQLAEIAKPCASPKAHARNPASIKPLPNGRPGKMKRVIRALRIMCCLSASSPSRW